jgi:ABC-type proline/glycine betaine transport system ATPase subunit
MHGGVVLQSGTPHELLTAPGHPYVAELVQTPRRHAQVIDNLIESGGAE